MKELVLATHNKGKLAEISAMLEPYRYRVVSAGELGLPEPEETGTTFAENALLKARAAMQASGLPALADDSGLCIASLDGAPGVYTADWAGKTRHYPDAFARIQHELAARGVTEPHPAAAFVCVLALALPGGDARLFEGRVEGRLAFPPRGENGFGYDPVFMPEGHTHTFGELPPEAKRALSHRARAFDQLIDCLRGQTPADCAAHAAKADRSSTG